MGKREYIESVVISHSKAITVHKNKSGLTILEFLTSLERTHLNSRYSSYSPLFNTKVSISEIFSMVFFTTSSPVLMKPNFGISKNDIDTNNRTSK